ncbi:formylglycine-generating enzyme family protein [Niveibacterium sp. SC-1]|uniref:formylglycine-generating enzyme family protein n=1 Tax=Niveibacterium sp. SC-1 TaxID=3135646 RepID=UPI00311D9899
MKPASVLVSLLFACGSAAAADYVQIPGGRFRSVLPEEGETSTVPAFALRRTPVTRGEFAVFLATHPQWRKEEAPSLFVGARYLDGNDAGPAMAQAPVTHVSWHAASAYCESEGARLPTWHEWEFAAAADATRRDARGDPAWRARILAWYESANAGTGAVGTHAPNAWGVQDMHGLVWEWVEDFNGLFVTTDSRNQGEQKTLETCGAAALSLGDRENYAVLMRVALLAALDARDSMNTLGFRCARDLPSITRMNGAKP